MRRATLLLVLAAAGAARAQAFPVDLSAVKVALTGFVHVDGVLLDQTAQDELDPATRAPLNTERIAVRRGHLRLDASSGFAGAALEVDGNTVHGPALQLIAAEVTASAGTGEAGGLPPLLASFGLTRIPFGDETRQHDLERPFLEQASVNRALFPGSYAPGLRARGAWRFLRYDVAVMSGEPIGAARFAAQAPSHALDVLGRAGVVAEPSAGVTLEAGLSGLEGTGFHAGTPTTKDQLVWNDANGDGIVQITELEVIPGSAAEPSTTFRRFALGADARLLVRRWGALFTLGAEGIWASNLDRALYVADPVATGRDQRGNGLSLSLSVKDLPLGLAAGVRYDRYDPDADASDARGGVRVPFDASVSTFAFMASVRLEQVVRLLVEYDRNRNAFGRGANGAPASLAADALTVRAEVAF